MGGTMALPDVMNIGTTTVCKIRRNGKPVAMREAKVVTWPQLFVLGGSQEFTAQEIFTTGWLCERIMSGRVRPWKSDVSKAASLLGKGGKKGDGQKGAGKKGAGEKGAGQKGAGKGYPWWPHTEGYWPSSWSTLTPSWESY